MSWTIKIRDREDFKEIGIRFMTPCLIVGTDPWNFAIAWFFCAIEISPKDEGKGNGG